MLLKNLGAAKNHHFLWMFSWQSPRGALGGCLSGHVWPHPAPPWCALDILDLGVPVVWKMRMADFWWRQKHQQHQTGKKTVFSPLIIAFLVCRNLLFPSWGQSWTLLHIFLRKTRYKKNRHRPKQFWISGIPWYWEFWSQNRQNKLDGSAVLAHHNFENLYPHRIPIYSQSDPILFTIIPRTKTTLYQKNHQKRTPEAQFFSEWQWRLGFRMHCGTWSPTAQPPVAPCWSSAPPRGWPSWAWRLWLMRGDGACGNITRNDGWMGEFFLNYEPLFGIIFMNQLYFF